MNLYKNHSLKKFKKYITKKKILRSIRYMNNDKKKDDEKVNFIFLKKIGKTSTPGKYKFKINQVKSLIKKLF